MSTPSKSYDRHEEKIAMITQQILERVFECTNEDEHHLDREAIKKWISDIDSHAEQLAAKSESFARSAVAAQGLFIHMQAEAESEIGLRKMIQTQAVKIAELETALQSTRLERMRLEWTMAMIPQSKRPPLVRLVCVGHVDEKGGHETATDAATVATDVEMPGTGATGL